MICLSVQFHEIGDNKMFKKSLIAASIAMAVVAGANASTVSVSSGNTTMSVEYAQGIGQVETGVIVVTPERGYATGDIMIVTVTGATLAQETDAATPVAITPDVTSSSPADGEVEFLEYEGNTMKFLVTTAINDGVLPFFTIGTTTSPQVIVTGAADEGKVTVSASGLVDTVEGAKTVDPTTTPATRFTFSRQFATAYDTELDGVIDVNALRTLFESAATSDTLVFENTETAATDDVTATGVTYTLWGDFSFLDADGDGELGGADDGSVSFSGTGSAVVSEDFDMVTVAATAFDAGTVGITVNVPGEVVIPEQSFQAQVDVAYDVTVTIDGTLNTLAKSSAGAWTLNGANVHVPFMPFGSQYSQSVTISNTSSQSGSVDLVIYVGDDTVDVTGIATVSPEGVTDISAAVSSAVSAAGLSGNLSFDVIVNAPDTAIEVTAVYYAKADGDRLRTK